MLSTQLNGHVVYSGKMQPKFTLDGKDQAGFKKKKCFETCYMEKGFDKKFLLKI